jgi:hypothetical protein
VSIITAPQEQADTAPPPPTCKDDWCHVADDEDGTKALCGLVITDIAWCPPDCSNTVCPTCDVIDAAESVLNV